MQCSQSISASLLALASLCPDNEENTQSDRPRLLGLHSQASQSYSRSFRSVGLSECVNVSSQIVVLFWRQPNYEVVIVADLIHLAVIAL